MPKRVPYGEGDWFEVPLRSGGFALGVVARANTGGVLLGYFFGPARAQESSLADVEGLRPEDAVLVRKFGHLGLVKGEWRILGRLPEWDRSQWPMPILFRHEELTGRYLAVIYDDSDPNSYLQEYQVPMENAIGGPEDGLMGAGFAEERLTRLLAR